MQSSINYLLLVFLITISQAAHAEPVVINPNGGWSWFGDERAVIDTERNVLYVGSLANHAGPGGKDKDGDVEVTRVDLATGDTTIDVLHDALTSYGGGDDHNVASLLILPNGKCLAAYTGHNNNPLTYFRTFDPDTETWGPETIFDWNETIPSGCNFNCTYNNLFYLPNEKTVVNISRNHNRCPNMIISRDLGQTWEYVGQLVKPCAAEGASDLYVNGYLKYSQQGNRIDLLATERHPRNFSNSLYHGYLANGALHRADGEVIDEKIDAIPSADATNLTQVFASGTEVLGEVMNHAWMLDFEHYPDGKMVALFKNRVAGSIENHHFFYGLYADGKWTTYPLAQAGGRLFRSEQDYTGLGAIDPNTPDVLYISTPIDPNTDKKLTHHELFQGQTDDAGKTWTWKAVTKDSSANNFRPIIPRWKSGHTALIWNRGTMKTSQNYNQEVVLLVDP